MAEAAAKEEKEKKRRKQLKRMGKILARAWELDEAFQEDPKSSPDHVLDLTSIGQKIDQTAYRLGRHGWEDFACDLGGVYNRHIHRKTKKATAARKSLDVVKELLGHKDVSLAKLASESMPKENGSSHGKKRKSESTASSQPKKKKAKQANKNTELAQREERAMEQLASFIEERGGNRNMVTGYRSRVTKKPSNGKFDVNFFNPEGQRFRSMLAVGRFLKLVHDGGSAGAVRRKGFKKKAGTREQEAEKKRLRKELEKLRKACQRATKALDDFTGQETETRYPIDDRVLMEEESSKASSKSSLITPTTCAAARVCDVEGFPGIPEHCIPDVLMTWDFLCTFQRALSLTPIALDDFAGALAYIPPEGQVLGDDVLSPPVYIAELHLGLLKLLLADRSSDDWWWSTLETDETEQQISQLEAAVETEEEGKPVLKVNMAALLGEVEDPLITTSWLRVLEDAAKNKATSGDAMKRAVKTALKLVTNKWVTAYLKKALEGYKTNGAVFTQRALTWLVDRVREARLDLLDRSATQDALFKQRAKVVEDAEKQMENLPKTVPAVTDEDAADAEYDEEEEESDDDESDDEADVKKLSRDDSRAESERPASAIPPKPLPTLVDILLPPEKPTHNSEFVNPFTWSHLVGATAARVLHRKKRIWNEVDDSLRAVRELSPLTIPERRERESLVASRVLTECVENPEGGSPVETAIENLCSGGSYLNLSIVERLSMLRLLIEAAYDTGRVYDVVDGNYKQRMSAMKSLEQEQRKAKKEAREKEAADQAAAREKLASEAKEKFLDEKREEIRALNEKSAEFTDEIIDSLTDEDILDFDEDIKADFEALPGPESFNKAQVNQMVERMREEDAFDTDALRVLTMEEIIQREKAELEEMEGQLQGFGGEGALSDPSTDRETQRSVQRLQRDIDKCKELAEKLPELREKAMEQLKDAIEDGTIKVLRSAITAAKKAKLQGPDDETGGIWATDLLRDAALELENAKQNKKVVDAQKDLVAKRNKCFIRSEPLGRDRFGNRFWTFDNDEDGHIWVETEYTLKDETSEHSSKPPPGFLDLVRDKNNIATGAKDMEEDLLGQKEKADSFRRFSRLEYHSSGSMPTLTKHHWGCQASEESLRAVIKNLDSRGIREKDLKTSLKEALEEKAATGEKHENSKEEQSGQEEEDDQAQDNSTAHTDSDVLTAGDETVFKAARESIQRTEDISMDLLNNLSSGLCERVRVRQVVDETKDATIARYENGLVTGWKVRRDKVEVPSQDDMEVDEENEISEPIMKIVNTPVWRVATDRGHSTWLTGPELMESLSRFEKVKAGRGYFENDSVFLSYRNSLGRHCGRAADAPYSCSPIFFARQMVKKESELYSRLKIRAYDNTWGGKSGQRALWTNSMKDYAFDFQTAKQGLLTLENAFFELTGEFADYENVAEAPDAKALLNDPVLRGEIELETIERGIQGLWNSPASRAVFIEIVSSCKSVGFLALALDLLCRNTTKYLRTHKLLNVRTETSSLEPTSSRGSRRLNAWQQANSVDYTRFFD